MSADEIKKQLATMPQKDLDEITAFLFHLRHDEDAEYQSDVSRRLNDKDPSHWLSPSEFERMLDEKAND